MSLSSDKSSGQCFIFAGGGTGGHLYPGLAVATELMKLSPNAQIVFACSNRAIDCQILEPLNYAVVPQPVRAMPARAGDVWPFLRDYWRSSKLAKDLIADLKPSAVVGLGGFAAGPVAVKAAKSNIKTALLNPDAVPGKANKLLARHANVIFTQFESTAGTFAARYQSKVRCVGCPIRPEFSAVDRQAAKLAFGMQSSRKTLLIFGGSLLSEAISLAVEALAEDLRPLADKWQIMHITKSAKSGQIESKLKACGLNVRTLAYCNRMDLAYAAADIVLARAGAGTVAELAATMTPSVLLPYPHHKDQHQRLNAVQLESAGAAIICLDTKIASGTAVNLRQTLLPILHDELKLQRMKDAAGGLCKTGAARAVAEWMLDS